MPHHYTSTLELTKDYPYCALTSELWGVFCEHFAHNLLGYNEATVYILVAFQHRQAIILLARKIICLSFFFEDVTKNMNTSG